MVIRLRNNTKSRSRLGLTVILDPKNPHAFIYAPPDSNNIIGIIGEEVSKGEPCNIITSGIAKVYVSNKAIQGSVIRGQKNGDRISVGFCKTAQSTDTPYFHIGTATETGRGLINVNINLSGGSAGRGLDGLSAYEVAVASGYTGTEQEWLLSLRGAPGIDGTDGDDGYTPVKEIDYFDGAKGDKGDQGLQGLQGLPGQDGSDATVTKSAVESVLTGEITSHTHAGGSGGLTQAQILTRQL